MISVNKKERFGNNLEQVVDAIRNVCLVMAKGDLNGWIYNAMRVG